jgi:hypothetical protein
MPSGSRSALHCRAEVSNKFLKFICSWLKATIQGTMRINDEMKSGIYSGEINATFSFYALACYLSDIHRIFCKGIC